jgi:imidazolonepropionase-like amidohydrolase
MLRSMLGTGLLLMTSLSGAAVAEPPDIIEARALFRRNLAAIAGRDRDAYLACYLRSETLARTGPAGATLGFSNLEKTAGQGWPDSFEALDLRLVAVRSGVVYGTYRYRVRYGADERSGLSERLFLKTVEGWRIAVSTAFEASPGTAAPPRALTGATLVDGTGAPPISNAVVLIREGRIECAGARSACAVPEDVGVLDLKGHWIAPGIVDAHVHFSQSGWADGRPDALDLRELHPYAESMAALKAHPERFFRSYLCSGVTAVFDVGGYSWTLQMAARTGEDTRAPRVSAAGPLLSTLDHWLNLPAERQFIYLKDEAAGREGVRFLASQGAAAVKVWFIVTPERPVEASAPAVLAAGEEAHRLGLPLIVHATGLSEAKMAVRAGARLLVHGVGDLPVDQEFIDLAKAKGTIYCPTLTVLRGYRRMGEAVMARRAPEIDDPNQCVDSDTREKLAEPARQDLTGKLERERVARWTARTESGERVGAANLKRVADAGIVIAMGTDAGNPLTLHGPSVYAEMEAMQAAGLTPMQVLVASTRGGAQAMNRERDLGTIEKGKWADLVVLDADPTLTVASMRKLRYVVRGGVVRSLEELRAVAAAPVTKP